MNYDLWIMMSDLWFLHHRVHGVFIQEIFSVSLCLCVFHTAKIQPQKRVVKSYGIFLWIIPVEKALFSNVSMLCIKRGFVCIRMSKRCCLGGFGWSSGRLVSLFCMPCIFVKEIHNNYIIYYINYYGFFFLFSWGAVIWIDQPTNWPCC